MQLTDVRSLFAYNEWANARIFAAASELDPEIFATPRGSSFSSIRDTLSHIATSEWVWLQRWRGESPTAPPAWGSSARASELIEKLRVVETERGQLLSALTEAGLQERLKYRNLKGEEFAQPLVDQMAHVVNHSTYHRGQVATLFRQAGMSAPATDLIVFMREQIASPK